MNAKERLLLASTIAVTLLIGSTLATSYLYSPSGTERRDQGDVTLNFPSIYEAQAVSAFTRLSKVNISSSGSLVAEFTGNGTTKTVETSTGYDHFGILAEVDITDLPSDVNSTEVKNRTAFVLTLVDPSSNTVIDAVHANITSATLLEGSHWWVYGEVNRSGTFTTGDWDLEVQFWLDTSA